MNKQVNFEEYEVGYDIPAAIGMDESEIQTPCLVLDLDALERNIKKMGDYAKAHGMRHRVHGKMHKSSTWPCCRKSLVGPSACAARRCRKQRFSRVAASRTCWSLIRSRNRPRLTVWRGCKAGRAPPSVVSICSTTWQTCQRLPRRHGTQIECLVEIDCGAGRCGVTTTPQVVELAKAIDAAEGLKFAGIQAYQGAMQHLDSYEERKGKTQIAIDMVEDAVKTLEAEGLECDIVGGGGTGSYYFESNSTSTMNCSADHMPSWTRLWPHPRQGR